MSDRLREKGDGAIFHTLSMFSRGDYVGYSVKKGSVPFFRR